MQDLSPDNRAHFVRFLSPLVPDETSRHALLDELFGADFHLLKHLTWSAPTEQFASQVFDLFQGEEACPRQNALLAILDQVRGQVGADALERFGAFYDALSRSLGRQERRDFSIPGYVFVSHSSKNNQFARKLAANLSDVVAHVWIDLNEIKGGHHWRTEIFLALDRAETVVICLTPDAVASPWVRREIRCAQHLNKRLLPLMVEPCVDAMQAYDETRELLTIQFISFQKHLIPQSYTDALNHLIRQLSDPKTLNRVPFKGLETFQETDAEIFFGRKDRVEAMLARLRAPADTRFLAVVGASGSGKSSLVRAGLLPVVRQGDELDSRDWRQVVMVPGDRPLSNLATVLHREFHDGRSLIAVYDGLKQAEDGLHSLAGEILAQDQADESARLLVFIDQLEQIFTRVEDETERAHFFKLIHAAATTPDGRCLVVVTLRGDYFHRLSQYPDMARLLEGNNLIVASDMEAADLLESIEGPARVVGLIFEAGLANQIVQDVVQQPGALPLLQYALKLLYEKRDGRRITFDAYREIGGVQKALANHATTVYDMQLGDSERRIARRVFLDLVRVDPHTGAITGRPKRQSELTFSGFDTAAIERVIYLLSAADHRLLVTTRQYGTENNAQDQDTWVRISHEALIQHWERFTGWIEQNRERLRLRDYFEQAAGEWAQADHLADYLLTGTRLTAGEDWLNDADAQEFITPGQRDYIEASIAEHHRKEEAERVRHAQEVALERRSRRRLQYLAVGLIVFLAVASVLALYANARRIDADRQRDRALIGESETLVQLARQQLTVDPVESISLSARALPGSLGGERPYLPEAELALTQALQISLELATLDHAVTSPDHVAFGPDTIAVGGSGLLLADYDLGTRQVLIPSDQTMQDDPYAQVSVRWMASGQLLSYDAYTVQVWDGGQPVESGPFDEPVMSAAPQPGGAQIVIYGDASLWLWTPSEAAMPRLQHTFAGDLQGGQWSSDGRWLAAWDHNRQDQTTTLMIWDTSLGTLHVEHTFEDYIRRLAWSPDSASLVILTNAEDHTAHLVPLDSTRDSVLLEKHTDVVDGVTFLTGGRFLTWGYDGTVQLWDQDGQWERSFLVPGQPGDHVRGVAIDDGPGTAARLLAFYDGGLGYVWDVASGDLVATLRGHDGSILSAAWCGDYVITTGKDHTARLWDAATGSELLALRGHTGMVLGAHWSAADDQRLLTVSDDGSLRLWQVFDAQHNPICVGYDGGGIPVCHVQARTLVQPMLPPLNFVRWVDDTTLVAAGPNAVYRRWSLASGDPDPLPESGSDYNRVVWSPAGTHVLFYTPGGDGQIVDAASGRVVSTVPEPFWTAVWLEAGLLVSDETGVTRLINGDSVSLLEGHTAPINDAQLSPTGDRLATAGADGAVGIWDARTGQLRRMLAPDNPPDGGLWPVVAVRWAGSTRCAAVSVDGHVIMWDAESGAEVWNEEIGGLFSARLAISPDGKIVAVAVDGFNALVLDARTGHELWTIDDHAVTGIAWSRDGTRLLTWGEEPGFERTGTAYVWDVVAKAPVLRLTDTAWIRAAAFNADDSRIATVGDSGQALVWTVWPEHETLIDAAQSHLTRDFITQATAD